MLKAKKFARFRKAAGLNYVELARLTGITRVYLMRLEKGVAREPSCATLAKLCRVFKCRGGELYRGL